MVSDYNDQVGNSANQSCLLLLQLDFYYRNTKLIKLKFYLEFWSQWLDNTTLYNAQGMILNMQQFLITQANNSRSYIKYLTFLF